MTTKTTKRRKNTDNKDNKKIRNRNKTMNRNKKRTYHRQILTIIIVELIRFASPFVTVVIYPILHRVIEQE